MKLATTTITDFSNYRLLACFAHPDDEAFPVGGTLAMYSSLGASIALITTTSGQLGEIRQDGIATKDTLGNVRSAELRESAQALGINRLNILTYKDSGMAGWDANKDPDAFINANPSIIRSQLVKEIRTFKPHVLLTFEPTGLYGHPDHIAISQQSTDAFHYSGEATYEPDPDQPIAPWKVSKLIYCARPLGYRKEWYDKLTAHGIEMPVPSDEQLTHGTPANEIDFVQDVRAHLEQKIRSILCHKTQTGPNWPYRNAPKNVIESILGYEHYIQVHPKLTETDLNQNEIGIFNGIQI
ncbi:MAG: hypothetical protein FI693_03260 [SAR202 cluster bacterium]|nr:hypothetical protein [SAR202 cluster bacterium]|tara:strand:+ start:9793 stop:10683 length:891 start_codon:yes stop_codon:yes gene_type:complete